jgi:hypothetical protein
MPWRNHWRFIPCVVAINCGLIVSNAAIAASSPKSEVLEQEPSCKLIHSDQERLKCYDTREHAKEMLARKSSGRAIPPKVQNDSTKQTVSEAAARAAFDKGRTLAAEDGLVKFDIAGKPLDRASDPCAQRFFVRADPLDNFFYAVNAGYGNAKGASVSYTNDQIAKTQTTAIDGIVSYVVTDAACLEDPVPLAPYISGFALAPWISANGTLNEPFKATERSTLKTGFDVQVEAAYTGLFDRQYFSFSPYLQTDFLDEARIGGINLAWEPVQHLIFLGQGRPINDYIGGFWQLRAEADLLQVDKKGLTNLALGQHDWMGATARAYVYLFPIASEHNWPSWLLNRISFIGTAQFFRDAVTGQNIHYYSAALQYALSSSIAVSFEYDTGTTKDTLVNANQYLVKLNYKQ